MAEHPGYIWIMKAAEKYHVSRGWLDVQIREGQLTHVKFPGDRHTYLVLEELDKLMGRPAVEEKKLPKHDAS